MNPANHRRTPLASFLIRWLLRTLIGALAILVLSFLGDWVVFQLRGRPIEQILVNRYLATPLKGNNTEVDFEGTMQIPCSRTLYPQSGSQPCWYLRRHPTQFERP
jgi:hypothetical protein